MLYRIEIFRGNDQRYYWDFVRPGGLLVSNTIVCRSSNSFDSPQNAQLNAMKLQEVLIGKSIYLVDVGVRTAENQKYFWNALISHGLLITENFCYSDDLFDTWQEAERDKDEFLRSFPSANIQMRTFRPA